MSPGYEPDTDRNPLCQDTETICGFKVIKIPRKPDYIPITQEEFHQEVVSAWSRGGYMEKTAAVFHGGELEWAALYNDDDMAVRGAVACRASEEYQLKLVNDPVPAVRKMLALDRPGGTFIAVHHDMAAPPRPIFLQCFKGIEAPGVHILDAIFLLKIPKRLCEPLPGIGQLRRGGQSRPCTDHHSVSLFNELLQLLYLGREVFDISACLYL